MYRIVQSMEVSGMSKMSNMYGKAFFAKMIRFKALNIFGKNSTIDV